jgi:hypothetical protein
MANTILTATAVTREALRVLHQKLNFVGSITRDYDDRFAQTGAKIGDTLKVRLPNQYTVRTGLVMDVQTTVESSVDLTVSTVKGVDMAFTDTDLTLKLDDFSERILEPAMAVLAANIEADALSMYKDVAQQINNTGSAATLEKVLLGRKALVDALAPVNDRMVTLNTQDNVDLVDALKGLFNQNSTISKQNVEGYLGRTAGFDFTENTLIPTHTRGGANTAYTTDTTALATDGTEITSLAIITGSGTIAKGDVFTVATLFRVHPETKISTGALRQFACRTASAGGSVTLDITPSIWLGGAKQNTTVVSASATAGLTFAGTASTAHGVSLAYQKGAFAFATADLVMPKGVDFAARENFDGVSMRIVRQFDINNGNYPCRLDVLYGYKTLRNQLACRLANR